MFRHTAVRSFKLSFYLLKQAFFRPAQNIEKGEFLYMKHLKQIKKAALASVLAASMVVSMFNFGSSNGRNGPKMEGKGLEG